MHNPETDSINKRQSPRIPLDCGVQISRLGSEDYRRAVLRDASLGGIGILSDQAYPIHSGLLLAVECEDAGVTRVTSRLGTVVWTKPSAFEDRYLLGIQFLRDAQGHLGVKTGRRDPVRRAD